MTKSDGAILLRANRVNYGVKLKLKLTSISEAPWAYSTQISVRAPCFHFILNFFFYQGFLSWTLTTHRTPGEERTPSLIPFYHFHSLTNIQTVICNFACVMTIIFLMAPLVFTRLLLDEIYHLLELPLDWLMMWQYFLFVYVWNDLAFLLMEFETRNRWAWSRIDYHPCIISELTNQVC